MSSLNKRRVLVTGARGFVGKNFKLRAAETGLGEVLTFDRGQSRESLGDLIAGVDVVVHLAGENRPKDPADFHAANVELTEAVCAAVKQAGGKPHLILASSI